jgi:Tol biopolymer transport system component
MSVLALGPVLATLAGAQSVELTPPFARGNLHHGTAVLSPDGRWVVFSGRYEGAVPGINSLYCVPVDGSAEPSYLYDHGDIPGVAREFDPGTVTFVHVTPDSRWAVFTVDERYAIYSAYLGGERRDQRAPRSPDAFERLAGADPSRDFQLTPDGSRAVFFGFPGLHSVRVDGRGSAVELVQEEFEGPRVQGFSVDASSTHVVYTLGANGQLPRRLFSVPVDGRTAPTELTPKPARAYLGSPPGGGSGGSPWSLAVSAFQLAPDGSNVLFELEETHGDCTLGCEVVTHLFVVPTDGSAPARRLASGDVRHAAFAPDSRRVVYVQAPQGGGPAALFAHALASDAPPLRLHEPADALAELAVLADDVLFRESPAGAGGDALSRVPLDGARRARAVSAPLAIGRTIREFRASPDGEQVVYSADADLAGTFTLFTGPLTFERARRFGSRPPEEVRPIGGSADVTRFAFTPDSAAVLAHVASPRGLDLERVGLDGSVQQLSGAEGASDLQLDDSGRIAVYRGAREHDTRLHVYSVPLDGSEPRRQLDAFGPVLGRLESFEIHPDGREAVFAAGSRDWDFHELHRVPLDLSAPPRLLEGLVVGDERLDDHRIEPVTDRLVYRLHVPAPFTLRQWLYSAPLAFSGPRLRLDPGEASVLAYRPVNGRVLFQKTLDPQLERYELLSTPADGSAAAQVLNGTLVAHGRVYTFDVSPDGTRAVYLAAQLAANRAELFSVPIDGSQPAVRLNPQPAAGGEVSRGPFRITPDNSRVVFAGDLALNNAFSLWAAPLAGGAAAQVLWTAGQGREVERLEVTSDSSRAVFTADGVVNGRHQLYVAPVDASAPAAALPATAGTPDVLELRLSPDGTHVVYTAAGLAASVLVDGSAAPVVLSPPLVADRRVLGSPVITDEWVLFRADVELRGRFDLHAAPIDGSLPARRVNDTIGASGVEGFAIAGDEIVFVAPSTPTYGGWGLFRAPLDGSKPPRHLNPPGTFLTTSSSPGAFQVHPDEHRVLFSAYSESGFVPSARLFLGFLGQPIRGAERP